MGLLDDLGKKIKDSSEKISSGEYDKKVSGFLKEKQQAAQAKIEQKQNEFKEKQEQKALREQTELESKQKMQVEADKKAEEERILEEKKQNEESKKLQKELKKSEKLVVTTSDLSKSYEIVDICFGFAKDRSYITQYERGLKMLKYHAFKKGCDAVIGLQIQMMEGKESTSGGSLTGALLGAVSEKVMEEMIFVDQIPKDGAILFGTGIKFK